MRTEKITSGTAIPRDGSGPPRVLVVDDEAVLAEALCEMLQYQGLEAHFVTDPHRAMSDLREDNGITVLLSDLRMPGIDGFELARRAKAERSTAADLQVVLLTGYASAESQTRADDDGISGFIEKPVKSSVILAAVNHAHAKALQNRAGQGLETDAPTTGATADFVRFQNMIVEIPGIEAILGRVADIVQTPQMPPTPVLLLDLLEDTMRRAADYALARGIALDLIRPAQADCTLTTDREALVAALHELVCNAVKFTRAGTGVRIGARVDRVAVIVFVEDRGPGLTADDIAAASRAFVDRQVASPGEGGVTGIGLFIANHLVASLGGHLEFDLSHPGRTRACIVLPRRMPQSVTRS